MIVKRKQCMPIAVVFAALLLVTAARSYGETPAFPGVDGPLANILVPFPLNMAGTGYGDIMKGKRKADDQLPLLEKFAAEYGEGLRKLCEFGVKSKVPTYLVGGPVDFSALTAENIRENPRALMLVLRYNVYGLRAFADYYRYSGNLKRAAYVYLGLLRFLSNVSYGFGYDAFQCNAMGRGYQDGILKRITGFILSGALPPEAERALARNARKIVNMRLELEKALRWRKLDQIHSAPATLERDLLSKHTSPGEQAKVKQIVNNIRQHLKKLADAYYAEVFKAIGQPVSLAIQSLQKLKNEFQKTVDQLKLGNPALLKMALSAVVSQDTSEYQALMLFSVGTIDPVINYAASLRPDVYCDGIDIVCALRRYHRENGGYPETLARLEAYLKGSSGEMLPTDPFTGKPYIYRKTGGGFDLYSAYINGTDDNMTGRDDLVLVSNGAVP